MYDVAGSDQPGFTSSRNTYTMTYHSTFYSHMDALCHFCYGRKLYNGNPSDVVTSAGASKLAITAFKGGIVTRGILMDIPRLKGVPYLEPGTPIFSEDLDAWERQAHIKVASGDMIFIRTGRWARRAEKGPWALNQNVAGLHATCARWLKQRDVAVLASDAVSDVIPSGVEGTRNPIHGLVTVALGTPIFDNRCHESFSFIYHNAFGMEGGAFRTPQSQRSSIIVNFWRGWAGPLIEPESICKPDKEFRFRSRITVRSLDVQKHANLQTWKLAHSVRKCLKDLLSLRHREARNENALLRRGK
jgi:kynurenine formamidase